MVLGGLLGEARAVGGGAAALSQARFLRGLLGETEHQGQGDTLIQHSRISRINIVFLTAPQSVCEGRETRANNVKETGKQTRLLGLAACWGGGGGLVGKGGGACV